jgi:phospholipase D1/2
VVPDGDPERWHAQVFRSVDAGSVKRFPRPWERAEMTRRHLVGDKNLAVEQSIHAAYVAAIRSEERFVYVENQYFIGGSYAWPSYRNSGACNLVDRAQGRQQGPRRRAVRRVRGHAHVGNPGSGPAQEILFWQNQTMEMMYRVVAAAMEGKEGGHPQDYLNFYCLDNREPAEDGAAAATAINGRHRRFMVYVHS